MTTDEPEPAAPPCKPRWYRLTPNRVVIGLLAIEGFLLLSQWIRLFPFNRHTGWTVLIVVAAVGVTLLLMFLWFLAALLFRWRFQYSLRSLLLLVVAVAIPCSWLATEMQRASKQREAAEAIQHFGGWVFYQYQYNGPPKWLENLLSREFFVESFAVLTDTEATDTDLDQLKKLNPLRELTVESRNVTDAGLTRLQGLKQLMVLTVKSRDITDADLTCLQGLKQLIVLDLTGTKVTDEGVKKLQQALPNCYIMR